MKLDIRLVLASLERTALGSMGFHAQIKILCKGPLGKSKKIDRGIPKEPQLFLCPAS